MLYGVVPVTTRCGGVESLVEHDHTGLLSDPDDTEALIQHVEDLVANTKRSARLARAAAENARHRWLWTQRIEAFLDAYQSTDRLRPPG